MCNPKWLRVKEYEDIFYEKCENVAKITINRPEVRNAFRPLTIKEMSDSLEDATADENIGVVIITGKGKKAFCSCGDQNIRGDAGYKDKEGKESLGVL